MSFEMDASEVPKVTEELEDKIVENRAKRKAYRQGRPNTVTGPAALKRREKVQLAMRLRREEGLTWDQIAPRAGYNSKQACYEAVRKFMDKQDMEEVQLYRDVEYSRLEKAAKVVMGIIEDDDIATGIMPDEDHLDSLDTFTRNKYLDDIAERLEKSLELKLKAVDRLVNVGARTGKVMGYDAPTKLEGNGMGGDITVTFAGAMQKPAEMAEPELIIEPQD
ncbi:Rnase E [Arthrobacter phage KBurrousTX]|uniref:Helix-turn-helix DNA binding domain protein n=1 Tax=Arthrobacter phage KBurrousTX TaxID=2315608 RepID=A0A386KB67_9CAUD|nr:Rnase E [Arthrobacter phage KBurrousTX]AYD81496.1 hypothetical protein KBurrousTX_2 [Arthrobacter phage KBurrousTX]